ncbi:molybdate ABC transporter substrate-binding protein [Clostridium magnum]|uniref:Putative binding protein n=1 Tax=Clostridium magnum DSM 2767 TaxID=1121326 RepID=A0A161YLE4_9CLOT|nr:molybdate ABC transporter substrate-binding protein [Clostridium magnum]KZL91412.1 putative binding protein precursor [Clostridium magnum DSM 2767]SHH41459.1 molybdate transport system substrate-binding protein [Clostridium magnum DSM 2767]
MKIKEILSSVLGFLLVSTMFIGCGQKAQTTTNQSNEEKESLLVYCAAGVNKPMEEIAQSFEKKYGTKIEYTYANSSDLIAQMEVSHKGDLCVLASDEDYQTANKKSLTSEKKDLVYHVPVIAVPKGNPAGITSIKDFSKSGVKVILGDPKTSPLGKLASKLFEKASIVEQVNKNVVSTVTTVNEIVTFLSMKKADASIIWEDNALNAAKDIDLVQIPKEENTIKVVPISTLKSSKDAELAKRFMDFTASDEAKPIFVKYNLKPVK